MTKQTVIWAVTLLLLWWGLSVGIYNSVFAQQSNWQCYTIGNTVTCSGMQNGRYVTCVTTYFGNSSSTQCY